MKPEVTDRRVEAYDAAVLAGFPRYGKRGARGQASAAQRAAMALGLKSERPIIKALVDAEHADVVETRQRRRLRQAQRDGAARLGAVYHGRSGDPVARARTHLERIAAGAALDREARRALRRGADPQARARFQIAEAAQRQAIAASGLLANRFAKPAALALDRLRDQPNGHALALMVARGQLDPRQFVQAIAFRDLCETASASPVPGVDFTREKVDGGKAARDPIFAYDGRESLRRIAARLGETGYSLLVLVAVQGVDLVEAAGRLGIVAQDMGGKERQAVAAARFREALGDYDRATSA